MIVMGPTIAAGRISMRPVMWDWAISMRWLPIG